MTVYKTASHSQQWSESTHTATVVNMKSNEKQRMISHVC